MFDFEYLGGDRPQPALPTVFYSFDSGIWKLRVIERIQTAHDAELVGPEDLTMLLRGDGLLDGGRPLIAELRSDLPPELPALLLEDLRGQAPRLAGLVFKAGSGLTKHGLWRPLVRLVTLVEESKVTPTTLGPLLRYLGKSTDLAHDPACVRQRRFGQCFADLAQAGAQVPELVQRFDFLLASSDPATNLVDVDEVLGGGGRRSMLQSFDSVMSDPTETQIASLIADASRFLASGRPWDEFVRTVANRLSNTLQRESKRKSFTGLGRPTTADTLLLSCIVLSEWRELAPAGWMGPLKSDLVRLDAILRDYADRRWNSDPLSERWIRARGNVPLDDEQQAGEFFGLPKSLRQLVSAIRDTVISLPALSRPWLASVEALLTSEHPSWYGERSQGSTSEATTFGDVVGQESAVASVQALLPKYRILSSEVAAEVAVGEPPFLIHGSPDSDVVTFAQLIARGILCEAHFGALPCGVCKTCRNFKDQWGNGGILDALRSDLQSKLREYASMSRGASNAKRWVLIIDHVDVCDPLAFDTILRTLEKHPRWMVFILLANEVEVVGEAVRSRSTEIELQQPAPR